MSEQCLLTSLTRITDFEREPFEIRKLQRSNWATADYVVGRIVGTPNPLRQFELANGRMIDVLEGNKVVGALGKRTATLEAVGDWEQIGADGIMEVLTGAGLFGKLTSAASWLGQMTQLIYEGHVFRDDRKLSMGDFVKPVAEQRKSFRVPVVLIVGTSMSAGKTTSGRTIIHQLKRHDIRVAAAKFTGAGRFRDVLSFQDAGADFILDFVDAGLPSTVVSETRFREAMRYMLGRISQSGTDVLVAEAGASPLEPYNGKAAIEILSKNVCCTLLCASDPYAVLGVRHAFDIEPDIVSGPAANTQAGIDLISKLTGLRALDLMRGASHQELMEVLRARLPAGLFKHPG